MNSHEIETPKKRLTAVSSPPLIGLKKEAKLRPICRPMTSPANSTAAKTIRTEKPSETPTSTCCSTAVTPAAESSAIGAIAGTCACAQKATRKARPTRTRVGTLRWAITGSALNRARTRRNGQRIGVTHARTSASVNVSMAGLADDRGNRLQRALQELDQRGEHPRPGDRQHRDGGDDLRNERERRFVDLRRRLEDADDQADREHREQDRRRDHQQHVEALLAEGEDLLGVHGGGI